MSDTIGSVTFKLNYLFCINPIGDFNFHKCRNSWTEFSNE